MVNIRVKVRVKVTDTVKDKVWLKIKVALWMIQVGKLVPGTLIPTYFRSRDWKFHRKLVGLRVWCGLVKQSWVGIEAGGIIKACQHSAPVDKGIARRHTCISILSILGWSLKLKFGKSMLQTLKFVTIVEKTLLVNFFFNRTTFTPPLSTLKFYAEDPKRRFLSGFK